VKVSVTIMSGVEDGLQLDYYAENGDGQRTDTGWAITIGRREDSDVCLRNDVYVSRQHAYIRWQDNRWWLEDCESRNGTFIESKDDNDTRVTGTIPISPGELFRVGRTWMRIETDE
jgi:pSer/pThr/pTyr-binding forkhead associated (FHA) protein